MTKTLTLEQDEAGVWALQLPWRQRHDLADEIHRQRWRRFYLALVPVLLIQWTAHVGALIAIDAGAIGDAALFALISWGLVPRLTPDPPRWKDALDQVPRTHGGPA